MSRRYLARVRLDARRFPGAGASGPRFIGVTNKHGQQLREGDILSPTKKLGKEWFKGDDEIAVVDYTPESASFQPFFYTVYGGEGGVMHSDPSPYKPPRVFSEWYVIGNVFLDDYNIKGSFPEKKAKP